MKLIIDIPEKYYNQYTGFVANGVATYAQDIIANGTPLPKGHGDLIDRSKLKIVNLGIGDYDVWGVEDYAIADALTVIPADKGE